MLKCDFCSEPVAQPDARRYKAKTFIFMGVESVGDWCACKTCADLVDTRNDADLAHRAWVSMRCQAPLTIVIILHNLFRIHREPADGENPPVRPTV